MTGEVEVTIDSLGAQGDGVGASASGTLYAPFTLPGEVVRVETETSKDGRIFGHLKEVVNPSAARIDPACRYFGECGGCALQHLDWVQYLSWKRDLILHALARKNITPGNILELQASPTASRRRAQFAARKRKGRVSLGFNARRSQRIVDLESCTVLRPAIVSMLAPMRSLLAGLMANGDSMDVQVTDSENGLDILLMGKGEPELSVREQLVEFAETLDVARITWGGLAGEPVELIAERRAPLISYGGVKLSPPAGAFLQATVEGEEILINLVTRWLEGCHAALDLFAGCGAFSLSLGRDMKVHAVDIAGDHLDALDHARRFAKNMREITVERRNLKRRPFLAQEMAKFDAVIFDPPRAGAREQALEIARSSVSRVVAVSCNPSTFARDAHILIEAGFNLIELVPVDQFLWNPHVELAASFVRP